MQAIYESSNHILILISFTTSAELHFQYHLNLNLNFKYKLDGTRLDTPRSFIFSACCSPFHYLFQFFLSFSLPLSSALPWLLFGPNWLPATQPPSTSFFFTDLSQCRCFHRWWRGREDMAFLSQQQESSEMEGTREGYWVVLLLRRRVLEVSRTRRCFDRHRWRRRWVLPPSTLAL